MARSAAFFPVNTIWSAQPLLILKLLKKYSGQKVGYALEHMKKEGQAHPTPQNKQKKDVYPPFRICSTHSSESILSGSFSNGMVAQPCSSTYFSLSQRFNAVNSLSFVSFCASLLNCSKHIGDKRATSASSTIVSAVLWDVLPNTQPPQPKPIIMTIMAPIMALHTLVLIFSLLNVIGYLLILIYTE